MSYLSLSRIFSFSALRINFFFSLFLVCNFAIIYKKPDVLNFLLYHFLGPAYMFIMFILSSDLKTPHSRHRFGQMENSNTLQIAPSLFWVLIFGELFFAWFGIFLRYFQSQSYVCQIEIRRNKVSKKIPSYPGSLLNLGEGWGGDKGDDIRMCAKTAAVQQLLQPDIRQH